MLAVVVALQLAAADTGVQVTLAEALQRAARLDPGYVSALGQIDDAEWGRRAALALFVLPALTVSTDFTRYSIPTFNFGTEQQQTSAVGARVDARFDLFTGGQKIAGLKRAQAVVEAARAGELEARFAVAFLTESDYYTVLADQELVRVAAERVRRAQEQFAIARARVLSGAAVQTDSLQLLLEVSRARVALLRQEAELRVARLQLGRRIGVSGPAQAAPLDTAPAPELPFTLEEAVRRALTQGPEYRRVRAEERAARADLQARRGAYLPRVSLTGSSGAFDDRFFPTAKTRSVLTLTVSFPLWDNAQREIALTRARVSRDVARVIREDLERGAQRDVAAAYDAYNTARASAALAAEALVVARENFRVQETRYRSGATAILDLLDAQLGLSEADAALIQARHVTRLALVGLEAMLGERLFGAKEAP